MKKIKGAILLVTLLVLLVGAVNAGEVSDDTSSTGITEQVQETNVVSHTDIPSQDNKCYVSIQTDENNTLNRNTKIKEETTDESVRSIVKNKQENAKTASSYNVETFQELRDALTDINDEYITVNIKDNIKLEGSIMVNSTDVASHNHVTINGEGKIIDGDHQHYFLNIHSPLLEVTINNLTINNCTGAPSLVDGSQLTAGGAIRNYATLILNNTQFNNNRAELYGGAIWNFNSLTVDNTQFNNNTAHSDNDASGINLGGAIYNEESGGTVIVNNTRFDNNLAKFGGAIYSSSGYLTVDNTQFNNNHADNAGGAIFTDSNLTVTNTQFDNNTADREGGAISNSGNLSVTNTQFNNNNAYGLYTEYDEIIGGYIMVGGYGGAISHGGRGTLTVANTEFNNNYADNYGGSISSDSALTVTNTRFNNNAAKRWGGAIYHSNGTYNITDTTFNKNTPANFIINQDNYIDLEDTCNYINVSNLAVMVDGEETYNGKLYSDTEGDDHTSLAFCDIPEGNHLVNLIVNGTNITNNEYILSDTIDVTNQDLVDAIEKATSDITIKLKEGLSYNITETITLDKPGITITIDGNGQIINGMQNQVFHINSGSSLHLKNITITNAKANIGGAIYNNGNLTITNSTLKNNQATAEEDNAYGGAIYNRYGILTITDTTLDNNTATATTTGGVERIFAGGGAIYNTYGNVTITNSAFTSNKATSTATATGQYATAKSYGGAIFNAYGILSITATSLNDNQAAARASGDWAEDAHAIGGAIYNTETLTITDSTLNNNHATATASGDGEVDAQSIGGAIYNHNTDSYNITGTSFYKNTPYNFIINETTKKIQLINNDSYISVGKFSIIADGKEIKTGTGEDALSQFTIPDEYKNVELAINGTDEKTINNRYILRGLSVEVHNYTELTEAIKKAQIENYDSLLIYLMSGDYTATESIIWEESETKNIIINANGLTLDGKDEHQFIRIGSGLNLTLDNVIITNYQTTKSTSKAYSHADAWGGVIYNRGNLSIINSKLLNNRAMATTTKAYSNANSRGGAIYNNNGNIIIINSILNDNTATTATLSAYSNTDSQGGAIYNNNGNITITNTTLNNNQATTATANSHLDANAYGGAIYNSGNLTITDSTLNDNTATSTTADTYLTADARGGAIYSNGALSITNTTLANNKVYSMASGTSTSAKAYGGAIYNCEDNYNYNITDTTFNKNTPANFIINEITKKIQLVNEDNYISIGKFTIIADGKEIANGTGINDLTNKDYSIPDYSNFVEIIINGTDDKTSNNRYILRGFSVEVHNYTELTEAIKKAQIENYDTLSIYLLSGDYNATESIRWEKSETTNLIINANGLTLDGKDKCQFIRIGSGLNLTLVNATLTNFMAESGGAIHNLGHLTIINSTFAQNNATNNGGAIYSENLLNVTGTDFIQNTASSGAAINFNGKTTDLIGNVFTQNTASVDGETLKLVGRATVRDNVYNSTDIAFKTVNLSVEDNKQYYVLSENVVLNFTIELEHPESYDENITEKLDKTLYINGIKNVTTKNNNYTLSNLEFGEYAVTYMLNHNISNTVTFNVLVVSELSTSEKEYDYYEGIKNNVTLEINDPTGEKGRVDISLKDGDKYQKLLTYHDVEDGYTFTTETLKEALENRYDNLDESYIINITYTGSHVTFSSTEFTLNIIKQRNTSIIYDIINNTEGNVQINITVLDTIYNTPINDAIINITGDITQTTGSGIITDTTLTPGSYTINVLYDETENYKSSEATINFNVEIDKDAIIEELEEQINNLTAPKETTIILDPISDKVNQNIKITGSVVTDEGSVAKAQVTVNIDGVDQTVTADAKGTFTAYAKFTTTGEKTITVTYEATEKYLASNSTAKVTIVKNNVIIIINEMDDVAYSNNAIITGKLTDSNGKALVNTNLKATINGKTITIKTDSKGTFKITTTAKTMGQNNITITFTENAYYNTATENTTFNVVKQDIVITIDKIQDFVYGDTALITGKVVDANGKAVYNTNLKATINGKTINIKTDANGMFTITTAAKTMGQNNVTISLPGNAYYNTYTTNSTFNVIKQDTTISVDSFNYDKGNFTIKGTFKDSKSKPLINSNIKLTLNGKTINIKTDANGQYTFTGSTKLSQLEFSLSFVGNAYYNAYEGTKTTMTFA